MKKLEIIDSQDQKNQRKLFRWLAKLTKVFLCLFAVILFVVFGYFFAGYALISALIITVLLALFLLARGGLSPIQMGLRILFFIILSGTSIYFGANPLVQVNNSSLSVFNGFSSSKPILSFHYGGTDNELLIMSSFDLSKKLRLSQKITASEFVGIFFDYNKYYYSEPDSKDFSAAVLFCGWRDQVSIYSQVLDQRSLARGSLQKLTIYNFDKLARKPSFLNSSRPAGSWCALVNNQQRQQVLAFLDL